ncbi:MAG: FMN-binding glutamate synthase family protein [Candidatus Polarisedimenticolaceae bacterium]|nr:FMN-binding glutamate synthase family protein [Candidatus Polarisedimenticolaceae bacterium]
MNEMEKGVQHLLGPRTDGLIFPEWVAHGMEFITVAFVSIVVIATLIVLVLFIIDITQRRNAIRHNYPVLGRFRYFFSKAGEFFRQYFFAMDREEMPFNRAEREWVERAADDTDNTIAFGSTKSMNIEGTSIFMGCPFPALESDTVSTLPMEIGPHCRHPYLASSIFNISGMSFGAISAPAVRALSLGAKMAGCWLNTGEGGLSPYHLEGGCDLVFQIGTAKYGVCNPDGSLNEEKLLGIAAQPEVKLFEIKLSQGAKPGKGGILPAAKINAEVAEIRGISQGEDSISPNRHPEIGSVQQLLDFVIHIRQVTGKPVGFKTVIGDCNWLDELCREIGRRGIESAPDFITVDGGDGGSGAAPMPLMDSVGLPLREALPLVADVLLKHGLKQRIRLIASGKLITPTNVAWALCAGADFINAARGFMFALGCIQALKCNKNTCPTGVTTHNARLQAGLDPKVKSVRVANYCQNIVHEVEMIGHSCGVPEPRALRRHHVRIVGGDGLSRPMDELYPSAEILKERDKDRI